MAKPLTLCGRGYADPRLGGASFRRSNNPRGTKEYIRFSFIGICGERCLEPALTLPASAW